MSKSMKYECPNGGTFHKSYGVLASCADCLILDACEKGDNKEVKLADIHDNKGMTPMQLLKEARDNEKFFMEAMPIYTRQLFFKYHQLQEAGFTEEQALVIILQHGQEMR